MKMDERIHVDVPATTVWGVFSDVERWPEWTESVTRITALDGPGIAVGKRFEIEQPRFPSLVWAVTAVEPGTSWTWRQRSFGATTTATHEVVPDGADRTLVRQRIEQRGPVGVMVGLLTRRLTRRYLEMEARGLAARSEELHRRDAAPA
jgi:uncharacterized membrane protein